MLPACRPNFAEAASNKQKVEQAWSIEWGYMLVSSISYFVLHVTSCNSECTAQVTNQPAWIAVRTVWEMALWAAGKRIGWHTSLHERHADWGNINMNEQHADSPPAKKRAWQNRLAESTQQCTRNTHSNRVHTKCNSNAYYLVGFLRCNHFTVA
jgi:hypothetical protein